MMSLLNEEDREGIVFKSNSQLFNTFDSAMESLMKRYPVFRLHPVTVNDEYKDQIIIYYKDSLSNSGDDYVHDYDNWKRFLYPDI